MLRAFFTMMKSLITISVGSVKIKNTLQLRQNVSLHARVDDKLGFMDRDVVVETQFVVSHSVHDNR